MHAFNSNVHFWIHPAQTVVCVHPLPWSISNRITHYIMSVCLHCTDEFCFQMCAFGLCNVRKFLLKTNMPLLAFWKILMEGLKGYREKFSQHKQNSCYVISLASKIKQAVWVCTGILNLPTLTAPQNHVTVVWWCHSKPLCLVCFNLVLQMRFKNCFLFKGVSVSN